MGAAAGSVNGRLRQTIGPIPTAVLFLPVMVRPLTCALALALLVTAAAAQTPKPGAMINKAGGAVTSVTFRVWAPNATAVAVAGDFNGWSITAHPLAKETGSPWNGMWTTTVAAARPGQAYKYHLTAAGGAGLWRKDPRARQVRTQSDGTQASVIYDPSAFDWEGDDFVPPWPNEIVMYELHPGTFYDPTPDDGQPATLDDAARRLDYLQALGVNMIALMPVSEFAGRHSWGYNPTDLFAIEETYGGPDALKRFVREAHRRGMGVQVDVVHNHYDGSSELVNFDGPANPYFYTEPGLASTPWGPRPRYDNANVRAFISDNVEMWLDEYKVWAMRWDSPRNITAYDSNNDGQPDTAIPAASAMMQDIHTMIRSAARPNAERFYSIAEDADVPGGYHGHWEVAFHDVIFARLLGSPLPAPFAGRLAYPALNERSTTNIGWRLETKQPPGFRVIFTDNHDKSGDHNIATDGMRLATDFDPADPSGPAARRKTMLAAVLTLTSAGTPMLFMGQEQMADDVFRDTVALDWRRAGRFPGIVRFHRDLIRLRRNLDSRSRALTFTGLPSETNLTGVAAVVYADENNGVMVYERRTGTAAESMLVAVNWAEAARTVSFGFPSPGPWRVHLNSSQRLYGADLTETGPMPGAAVATSGGNNWGTLTIPAGGAVILGRADPVLSSADADGNGLDDGWEMLFGAGGAAADPDADGFDNAAELANGTDPTVPDRAVLAGTFNDWNIGTKNMRWDPSRRVWRYVARFATPGTQLAKAFLEGGWAAGADHAFAVAERGVYEITYDPATGAYATARADADADGNGMADAWERFHFHPATAADPAADPDGDGVDNRNEFLRGSDPTLRGYRGLAVVGGFNGWNWAADNMRPLGHGVWGFAVRFRTPPADRNFKVAAGPTNNDDNWGDTEGDGIGDYKSATDMRWPAAAAGWQFVRYNEMNRGYSVTPLAGAADADGDGMPDLWELCFGLDPFAALDGLTDADGDGVANRDEFRRGSLPGTPDHFGTMRVVGTLNGWNFNSHPMRWNPAALRWELLVRVSAPASGQRAKFVAGTSWDAPNWGENNLPADGVAERSGGDFLYNVTSAPSYLHFRFDEVDLGYLAAPMSTADGDGDGLADAWAEYHGVTGAGANPDGDPFTNAEEFARGSDPTVPDAFARNHTTMLVNGSFAGWNFASAAPMALVGDHTWRADIVLASTAGAEFKFATGPSWTNPNWGLGVPAGTASPGGNNISLPQLGAGTYRFVFNDATLAYSVTRATGTFADRYPGLTPATVVRGRPALLDYLFGGTLAQAPAAAHLPTAARFGQTLRFTFVTRTDDPGLGFRVQTTSGLGGAAWTTNGITTLPAETLTPGVTRRTYEVPVDGPSRFLRVVAEPR